MKKKLPMGWIIAGVVVFIFVISFIGMYNGLVGLDEQVNNKWSQVETVYQRRADLIPNLVNTVKGVAEFEKSTYLAVTEARTKQLNVGTLNGKVQEANELDGAFARLVVPGENYPLLNANRKFVQ